MLAEAAMRTSDAYRKIAEEYDRLASEAEAETDRLALLDLARTWFDTASRQAEMSPVQIAKRSHNIKNPRDGGKGCCGFCCHELEPYWPYSARNLSKCSIRHPASGICHV